MVSETGRDKDAAKVELEWGSETGPRGLHSSTSQLNVSTFGWIRWVPSVERRVITHHSLDTKRLTDQTG